MSFLRPRSSSSSAIPPPEVRSISDGSPPLRLAAGDVVLTLMRAASVSELAEVAKRLLSDWLGATEILFVTASDVTLPESLLRGQVQAVLRSGETQSESAGDMLRFAAPLKVNGAIELVLTCAVAAAAGQARQDRPSCI